MMAGFEALDVLGLLLAFVFTVLVLLYAFGDIPYFRLAIHIFIGVAAGYASAVALRDVVYPYLVAPALSLLGGGTPPQGLGWLVLQVILVVLLLLKLSRRSARLGNPATAVLVGVGAAVAIGGAVQGTLIPQTMNAISFFPQAVGVELDNDLLYSLALGIFMLVGVVSTLAYFHFGAGKGSEQAPQRSGLLLFLSEVGQLFIAITFGVVFAGVYLAALSALIERLFFLWNTLGAFLAG